MNYPKLHNAMWPGLVGKGGDEEGAEPPISLDRMLELTAGADVNGQKFEGIDYFLFHPHTDPDASEDELKAIADKIAGHGFTVGSLVAPVWPGTVGDSAMGDDEQQQKFLTAVEKACRIAKIFNNHGVRKYGVIRIDSAEFGIAKWREDPKANTTRIAETFKKAAKIAADNGERLAAEGEICWAGMHSWKDMLNLLEEVGMPESLGFQCDLAHTYLYLMGYNAPEHALLQEGYSEEAFDAAYKTMTDALRPWTIDFHVAQNDGSVHGAGSHDKTGKHCPADDPNGKVDIVKCAGYWLEGAAERGIEHICWDGCMFPNAMLETPETWNTILASMIAVRDAHGWNVQSLFDCKFTTLITPNKQKQTMANISLGAEVYTWFMRETGAAYDNKLGHMIEIVEKAGFQGIEPMHFWMGDLTDPAKLADKLDQHNVKLAGIALVLDWNNPEETEDERRQADEVIETLKKFPGAPLCTVQMPNGRHDLEQRRLNLVANVNAVSRRAHDAGLRCSFHPNSPDTSINRTEEDYAVILNGLDPSVTGWTPDVGHIINGGMDPLTKMKEFSSLINHVHYKDWDGNPEWTLMGEGKVDFPGITQWLVDQDLDGWIICEDEADKAIEDPDGVTLHDGKYCQEKLIPIING